MICVEARAEADGVFRSMAYRSRAFVLPRGGRADDLSQHDDASRTSSDIVGRWGDTDRLLELDRAAAQGVTFGSVRPRR